LITFILGGLAGVIQENHFFEVLLHHAIDPEFFFSLAMAWNGYSSGSMNVRIARSGNPMTCREDGSGGGWRRCWLPPSSIAGQRGGIRRRVLSAGWFSRV